MGKYKRILLKLSGESLMGTQAYGIDANRLGDYAAETIIDGLSAVGALPL